MEASQRNYVIAVSGTPYVTITGLVVTKSNLQGVLLSGSTGSVVTSSTFSWDYDGGIDEWMASGQETLTITGNTVAYNGGAGIVGNNLTGSLISGNTVYNNDILETYSDQGYEGGIKLSTTNCTNNTIQNNLVYLNGHGTTGVLDSQNRAGIYLDGVGTGNIVRFNLVYQNLKYGIFNENSHGTVIYGNVVWGNTEATAANGYARGIQAGRGNQNVLVYNNTLYGNTIGLAAEGDNGTSGVFENNAFKNNVSVGNSLYQFMAIYGGENDGTYGLGNIYTYNSFGAQASKFIEWGSGVYESTYSAWETAAGNCGTLGCSHSIESTPTFANASADQFWLASGSPGIDTGTNLGSPYNIELMPGSTWPTSVVTGDQNGYGAGWEVGAYIFADAILQPPTSLQAVAH